MSEGPLMYFVRPHLSRKGSRRGGIFQKVKVNHIIKQYL